MAAFPLQGLIDRGVEPGTYIPVLATSWELSPDKKAYTFHLRQGVKFFDGTDFNAQAVKWQFDYNKANSRSVFAKWINSCDVLDDYTVRFNLVEWNTLILDGWTGTGPNSFISPTAFEKNGMEWTYTHPIGTGPFKLKEYAANQWIKWERNPDYWNQPYPYFDEVDIIGMPESMTALASLLKGEIDGMKELDILNVKDLTASGKYEIQWLSGGHLVLYYNMTDTSSAFSDVRVRKAMEYAINKDLIASTLGLGYVEPVYEVIFGINEVGNPGTTPRTYDPDKAKQLLAEAGYPNGFKATLVTLTKFYGDYVIALQGDLGKVGIDMAVDPQGSAAWTMTNTMAPKGNEFRYERERGGAFTMVSSTYGDLNKDSLFFPGMTRPAKFQELLDESLFFEDWNKVVANFEEMERIAYDQEVMMVPLWSGPDLSAYVKTLKTEKPSPFYWGGRPSLYMLQYCWYGQ